MLILKTQQITFDINKLGNINKSRILLPFLFSSKKQLKLAMTIRKNAFLIYFSNSLVF